jgi:hypothetical protein
MVYHNAATHVQIPSMIVADAETELFQAGQCDSRQEQMLSLVEGNFTGQP